MEVWRACSADIPENLRIEKFYLGDFGLAMKVGDPVVQEGCTPQRFYEQGKYPTFACDMWSYMAIFAILCFGVPPFTTWQEGGLVSGIIRYLGPLPEKWKGR